MTIRYRVSRQSVRFCKHTYHKGEFLPESFSERDFYRVLYPSRIEKVNVPDTPEVKTAPVESNQVTNQAEKAPAAPTKPTGASLSGQLKK